ncbi:MAG: hypothetical protein EOP84_20765 [Verrucomicrobiaceae bacterium]|nr:MAG: hypothetical protein EOP84_20765 [Verrucomicrobiaceae bacterium]
MQTVTRQELAEIVAKQTPGEFIHVIAPRSAIATGVSFEIAKADPKRAMIVVEYMTSHDYLLKLLDKKGRAYAVTYEGTEFKAEIPLALVGRTLTLHLSA